VPEGGVAGAEVVDGNTNAECLDAVKALARLVLVGHDHGLGDLEGEVGRLDSSVEEDAGDVVHEPAIGQLARGDVHVHPKP
jgi:hypothetical protein